MKSKKLQTLGRYSVLKSQFAWLAERNEQEVSKANHLKLEFPNWHESDTRERALAVVNADPSALAEAEAFEAEREANPNSYADAAFTEVKCFAETARTLGLGKANIAIALTQILNEYLIEGRSPKGLPAIKDWKDVSAILRTIEIAESSLEYWALAIGFDKIRELIEVSVDEK